MVLATWPNTGATAAAMELIAGGGRALDAVEAGARVPEADPEDTSVGYGGLPDRDGHVTLDACIMDEKGNAGSVTFLRNIKHAVSVARHVMERTPHVMLSGEGALQFARAQGFVEEDLLTDASRKAWEAWQAEAAPVGAASHDTIGILAIDGAGDLSGACTTSGLSFKMHGRVGDSPIIGAGMYADNEVGAACATGVGELVMRTLGSFLIVELMRQGRKPQQACEEAVSRIVNSRATRQPDAWVGYLALDKRGEHGAYSLGPGFRYTLFQAGENRVFDSEHESQSQC